MSQLTQVASPPRVGIGVFVFKSRDDPRFCFGLRKGSHGSGTWSLPGGHLEYGESFERCAVREIAEETGLEIEDVQFLTAVNTPFSQESVHYVTILMTAYAKAEADGAIPEPKILIVIVQLLEPDKCEEWRWCSLREMIRMHDLESDRLFEPLSSLILQRPAVCTALLGGSAASRPAE
ncbi:hypothetical protein LTR37_005764 [Vermiconidia calcicola]|uniref:Uncharacterized protein n=1 Tax=Vermiconidia calcicola TaxID=1690605 RepID=A0ACC3NIG3_9PEZI|nr:hypothetical protein LTR37_005764 [Vermiconidia calcicola]